jgi:hypothetical protein
VEQQRPERQTQESPVPNGRPIRTGIDALQPLRVFPFGISRNRLEQAARELRVPVGVTQNIPEADLVLTLRN